MTPAELVPIRRNYLWLLYALAAVLGAVTAVPSLRVTALPAATGLAAGIDLALLLETDGKILGKPLPRTASWVVILLWPLAAPSIAIATRGIRGLWLTLLHAAALWATYLVFAWGTWWLRS
jgi:hypothetical protein